MNVIDSYVLHGLGRFAHRSEIADRFVIHFLGLGSVKLLPMVALAWAEWFAKSGREQNRRRIAEGLIGLIAGFVSSRLLQDVLPARPRPLSSGDPDFIAPYYTDPHALENWSSFPSDHAVISFALATIIFKVYRPLGIACYVWSTFVVCLPRVYGGLHYASDVIAGAAIGIASVMLAIKAFSVRPWLIEKLLALEEVLPSLFYGATFVFAYQFVTLFDDFRKPASALGEILLR